MQEVCRESAKPQQSCGWTFYNAINARGAYPHGYEDDSAHVARQFH